MKQPGLMTRTPALRFPRDDRVNERYQELYQSAKDRLLAMPKGKQFDFSEAQIFGR